MLYPVMLSIDPETLVFWEKFAKENKQTLAEEISKILKEFCTEYKKAKGGQ